MKTPGVVIGVLLVAGAACAGPQGTLNPGEKLPAWSLVDSAGATVTSQDLAGKTYLLWYYPKAMTSGCTAEGCALRDNFADFAKMNVEVLGVSFDKPESNAEFIKENHFPFRLLSDRDKSLAIVTGAADSAKRLFARRISYLVGPDGKVLKTYSDVDPSTHAKQVLADLAALQPAK
jgi:peroxiredoxin Q/BCP